MTMETSTEKTVSFENNSVATPSVQSHCRQTSTPFVPTKSGPVLDGSIFDNSSGHKEDKSNLEISSIPPSNDTSRDKNVESCNNSENVSSSIGILDKCFLQSSIASDNMESDISAQHHSIPLSNRQSMLSNRQSMCKLEECLEGNEDPLKQESGVFIDGKVVGIQSRAIPPDTVTNIRATSTTGTNDEPTDTTGETTDTASSNETNGETTNTAKTNGTNGETTDTGSSNKTNGTTDTTSSNETNGETTDTASTNGTNGETTDTASSNKTNGTTDTTSSNETNGETTDTASTNGTNGETTDTASETGTNINPTGTNINPTGTNINPTGTTGIPTNAGITGTTNTAPTTSITGPGGTGTTGIGISIIDPSGETTDTASNNDTSDTTDTSTTDTSTATDVTTSTNETTTGTADTSAATDVTTGTTGVADAGTVTEATTEIAADTDTSTDPTTSATDPTTSATDPTTGTTDVTISATDATTGTTDATTSATDTGTTEATTGIYLDDKATQKRTDVNKRKHLTMAERRTQETLKLFGGNLDSVLKKSETFEERLRREKEKQEAMADEPQPKRTRLQKARVEVGSIFKDIPLGGKVSTGPAVPVVSNIQSSDSTLAANPPGKRMTRLERARLETLQSFGGSNLDEVLGLSNPKKAKQTEAGDKLIEQEELAEEEKENQITEMDC